MEIEDNNLEIIKRSGLFDQNWYVSQYPDVAEDGCDPVAHYLKFGAMEMRNPSPYFDTFWYLENYQDVAQSGVNPLLHFILNGRSEGRMPLADYINEANFTNQTLEVVDTTTINDRDENNQLFAKLYELKATITELKQTNADLVRQLNQITNERKEILNKLSIIHSILELEQNKYNLEKLEINSTKLNVIDSKINIDEQQTKEEKSFNEMVRTQIPSQSNLEKPSNLDEFYFNLIYESGMFDPDWYLTQYKEQYNININPLEHYILYGTSIQTNPSNKFSTSFYLESNPDIKSSELHPFLHYLCQGKNEGRIPLPPPPPEYTSKYNVDEPEYIPRLKTNAAPVRNAVRVIAFYLPQFHAIAENDKWWGEGFTEWSNVRPAVPQFKGHYQPHVPDSYLGYYNLLERDTQAKQVELAKQYGIEGFCFYLYWFTGHRLLEQPVDNYLNDLSLDLPFCVCWANENWSRRWDGLENDLLIEQHYSPEDDINFIANTSKYLKDPRYIRINGKPLLLIYRPNLFPSMRDTAERWRHWCRENGVGEIYLTYPQSFECINPEIYGFDAACEFPPNNSSPPTITNKVERLVDDFQTNVYDWRIFIDRSEDYQKNDYTLFRSTTPSWDNTARKKNKGTVFHNSCPKLFEKWLTNAFVDTLENQKNPDERIVFINAWNEWAEGAHLEPDTRYGYAWLQAVYQAHSNALSTRRRIVIVSHDAHPHGAQILCLNFARYFSEQLNFDVDIIVLGEGRLIPKYAQYAQVHTVNLATTSKDEINILLGNLRRKGSDVAIVNTTVSGNIIPFFKEAGFNVVSLVHEMPGILRNYNLQEQANNIADYADKVIFPAKQVLSGFNDFIGRTLSQSEIRPQGLYLPSLLRSGANKNEVRNNVRNKLGIPSNSKIIMCAGYADHRKGFDLFVDSCIEVMEQIPNVYALWVGHLDNKFVDQCMDKAESAGRKNQFIFTGLVDHPQEYYLAADIYALTSREDPFPSVVMEALDALTPVVAFKDCGGFEELLKRDCGILAKKEDPSDLAKAMIGLLKNKQRALKLAKTGKNIVETELSFRHYLFDLLSMAGNPLFKVSVVVPNYKYAKYIKQRLETAVNQTYPIFELIVLDDCSPDNSVEVITDFLNHCEAPHQFVINEKNSGSVFKQWQKGVEMARGDLVWIAEADDLAEPEFLERLVTYFQDPEVILAYSQSKQIDEHDNLLSINYLGYTNDVGDYWQQDYVINGEEEIKRALCIKNTIPNVSGVLFRRDELASTLKDVADEMLATKVAGDWILYLYLAAKGKVAFNADSLNAHRRHTSSVTKVNNHLDEVISVQKLATRLASISADQINKMDIYVQKLSEYFAQH